MRKDSKDFYLVIEVQVDKEEDLYQEDEVKDEEVESLADRMWDLYLFDVFSEPSWLQEFTKRKLR